MTLSQAIRELRRLSGKSQQVLATELGMTTRSLQLYELGRRIPEPKNLLALAARADALDNDELYEVFLGDALLAQLKPPAGYEIEVQFRRSPVTARSEIVRTVTKRRNR
jgi:transcriptional regulator with XRE-family HTH domain